MKGILLLINLLILTPVLFAQNWTLKDSGSRADCCWGKFRKAYKNNEEEHHLGFEGITGKRSYGG